MTKPRRLPPELLYRSCTADTLPFDTTEQLEDLNQIIGQERALDAVRFGIGIHRQGYNLFVLGPPGLGKHTVLRGFLQHKAQELPAPDDWCYVNDFEQSHKPRALRLPPGRAAKLRQSMDQLVEDLRSAVPAAFESEQHRTRMQELEEELKERQATAFSELGQEASRQSIAFMHTPTGFAFGPMDDKGEVISPADYEKLPEQERQRVEKIIAELQDKLKKLLHQIPRWQREIRNKLKELIREVAMFAVGHLMEDVKTDYADLPEVLAYLEAVEQDVVENIDDFRKSEDERPPLLGLPTSAAPSFRRYRVNVLVDHPAADGAPVVFEDNPTYQNLVGRTEHLAQMGTLTTDFTLLKPGALHRATGGYLVLDAHKVLMAPYAWEGLKRALSTQKIRIESLGEMLSLISTVSLDPAPIPLDFKLVLVGDRMLYYLLRDYDPDFAELFKVGADFDEDTDRDEASHLLYARLIATLARRENMLAFDRRAVARVIEHGARLAGDSEKLSTHMRSIADLLRESDHWARLAEHAVVAREDVQKAIDKQIYRLDRVRDKLHEAIRRGTLLIDTTGGKSGQVNGLSVIQLGDFSFGQPSRITATARLGDGKMIDIEREVELSGAIHSKGVLILSQLLATRFAKNQPLSFSSSLVFEQSYGMVEGDSASLAELCALLSALAEIPVKQSLAVTGSVNQQGEVQPIGGVNEKVEGFFDVCSAKGLNGKQGVLIPAANVKDLMLRGDVVEAAAARRFHVYPVRDVDQAIELLMGLPAGEADADGVYPPDTVNGRVQARLAELTVLAQTFSATMRGSSGDDADQ